MKIRYLICIFLIIPFSGLCQCKYNPYYEVTSLPENALYFYLGEDRDPSYNDIKKIASYTDNLFNKAKTEIINRSGLHFFEKLKMRSVLVRYINKETVDAKDESLYDLSSQQVTYEIDYNYVTGNFDYEFTVYLDQEGNISYDLQIPSISQNKDFEKLTDICTAIKVVKALPGFANKKVDTARLLYNKDTGNFCWAIAEQHKNFPPGEHTSVINEYYVNANNNKLETVKKITTTLIIPDEYPVKKRKKATRKKHK